MADFFLSNLKSTTTASQNSMKFPPCSAVIRKVILLGTANFLSASIFSLCSRCRVNPFQMKFLISCELPVNLRLKSIYPHKYWIFCGNIGEPVVVNMH